MEIKKHVAAIIIIGAPEVKLKMQESQSPTVVKKIFLKERISVSLALHTTLDNNSVTL